MARLSLICLVTAVTLVGCGSPEPVVAPSEGEKAAITESKSAWTQDKLDAFNKAHDDARTGKDEQSNGLPAGKKGK